MSRPVLETFPLDYVECFFKVDEDSQYISFIMLMSCDEVLEPDDVLSGASSSLKTGLCVRQQVELIQIPH